MIDAWLVRWDTACEARPVLINPSGPGEAESSPTGFVAAQGYLFESDQLTVGVSASTAARVAAAYEQWHAGLFDKLRGGFALAVWDEDRRCLVIGRDAMGLVPCFYWWNGQVLLASPSLDAILRQPPVETRINRALVAEYLQNVRTMPQIHETFYEKVRRLPPAHSMTVNAAGLSLSRYWDPVPPGFAWASDDEVSRFGAVFETAVERVLSVGADSLALSGGFDSVSLAVVAARRRGGRPPLHAVSLRFTDPSCDEGPRQLEVARALEMPHLMRSLAECLDDGSFGDELLTLSRRSPGPVMSAWQPMYGRLLGSAADRGLRQLMMGTGGDEMFYVNMGYATDCLGALDMRALWRFHRACQATWPGAPSRVARYVLWDGAVKGLLRHRARSVLDHACPALLRTILQRRRRQARPPWLAPGGGELSREMERRFLEVPPVATAPGEGAYVRAMRWLPQSPTIAMELEQSYAWAEPVGFRLLFPYFDRDLVELSLRMRPEHLIAGGRAKAPLRGLVASRLPSLAMPARKVLFGDLFHSLFQRHGERAWRALGGPLLLGELEIVDPKRTSGMMADYFSGASGRSLEPWLVLSMEMWLQARHRGL